MLAIAAGLVVAWLVGSVPIALLVGGIIDVHGRRPPTPPRFPRARGGSVVPLRPGPPELHPGAA